MPNGNNVYIIEDIWYDTHDIVAIYNNIEAAISHVEDPNFVSRYDKDSIYITEYGIRTRKQLRKITERIVYANGKRIY